jgi:hypothetical protein
VLWFEQGWTGGRRIGFRQVMWLVMLESAKDPVSGVDPSGQHVPPRVRYGTAC